MATVTVNSWAEFVSAVGVEGNIVECPNTVWDLAEEGIYFVPGIWVNCSAIHGNGLVIRNANFAGDGKTSSQTTGLYFRGNGIVVENLHFINAISGERFLSFHPAGKKTTDGATVRGCTFSAIGLGTMVINGSGYSRPTLTRCSFLYCGVGAYNYEGNFANPSQGSYPMPYFSYCDILYFGDSFTNTDNYYGSVNPFYGNRCRIQGKLGKKVQIDYNSTQCVVNGVCDEVNVMNMQTANTLIINSEYADTITGKETYQAKAILATTEQLADIEYLSEAGFPIGNYWTIDSDGVPAHSYFPAIPDYAESPLPLGAWRIDPLVNDGFPHNGLLRGLSHVQIADPVDEKPYISIYDKRTKQDEFDNNGIILCPTSCIVTETINDKWALDLTHPVDPDGKWRYIEPSAIVKALGQLFTLRKIQHSWRGNSGSVQAAADHIFYQMLDGWVYPGARITGQTGLDVLHAVDTYTDRFPGENQTMYYWTYDSDLDVPAGVDYSKWCPTTEGATPLEFVMGRDGLLAMCGGELYRDNFYYSVKQRMENAEDNVFEIRVGKNLKGITRIVDFSQFCVHFTGYDQYGQWISVSWTDEYAYQFVPHTIIRSKNFNIYVDESTLPEGSDENAIYERSYELLEAEVMAFFNANCAPIVSFKVDIEDVKDNPDFKMFVNPDKLKVGNTGRLYDERLGVDMGLKISQTKTDAITGKVIEVTFGTVQSFTGGQNFPAVLTDLIPVPQGGEIPLRDKHGEALYDRNGEALMERI